MESALRAMNPEKRDLLINSALDEFSKGSYEKASTNNIARNAGISKGLLFHYFKTKKQLYDTLEEFALEHVINTITDNIDWTIDDIFDRLVQIAMVKIRITSRYPRIYDFVIKAYDKKSVTLLAEKREQIAPGLMNDVYTKGIDYSRFREDIDLGMTIQVITWTLEKYSEELLKKLLQLHKELDYMQIMDEFKGYVQFFKKAFYKEGIR